MSSVSSKSQLFLSFHIPVAFLISDSVHFFTWVFFPPLIFLCDFFFFFLPPLPPSGSKKRPDGCFLPGFKVLLEPITDPALSGLISAGVGGEQMAHCHLGGGVVSEGWCSFHCCPIDRKTCSLAGGCLDLQWGC